MVTLAALWLSAALVASQEPIDHLHNEHAKRLVREAQTSFEEGDYATASRKLEHAYLIEPVAELLYPWAQAERHLGHCDAALELYRKFLESGPSERLRDATQQNLTRCKPLPTGGSAPPPPTPAPAAAAPPPPPPVTSKGSGHSDKPPPPPSAAEEHKTQSSSAPQVKPRSDVLAGSLVGSGATVTAVGAALWGAAAVRARDASTADSDDQHQQLKTTARRLTIGGATLTGVGGALILAGIIRYAVLSNRGSARKGSKRTSWIIAPGYAAITLISRF